LNKYRKWWTIIF